MIKPSLTRFIPERMMRYGKVDLCPLDGDIPVLQFINTHRDRGGARPKNYLKTYDDFITWCYEIRVIDQDIYNILDLEGRCYQHEAAGVVMKATSAREMLYELVYCMMHDEPVHPITLGDLNRIYNESNKHLCLAMTAYGLQEVWNETDEELAYPLWQIIKLAVHFLMSGDVKFIKKCRCGSLYLDKTKNSNRRYCNPLSCGSAARSKQYYQRKKLVNY